MALTRRAALAAGSVILAATVVRRPAIGATPRARPNILWLVSEDNNPYIGAYGDKLARTPNIDALARKGVLYRNAFSTGPVCATSRFTLLTGVHAESCGPAHHHRAIAHLPAAIKTLPEHLRASGYYCTNNFKTDYNCDVDPRKIWDESSPKAQWYNRPDGAPFMSVYTDFTTHESQLFFDTPGAVGPEAVRVPAFLPDSAPVRQDIASYYNRIEKMDANIGARLRQLEERGVADDTIIFYFADNGGVLPRSKHLSYDEGYRTPLIVYVPPKWRHLAPAPAGTAVEGPVSYIDLVPTVLSLIGQEKPDYMQGRALMGPLAGTPERYVFGARDRMDERYDFCRTVSDGRYRLIRNYLRDRPASGHMAYAWQMKSYQDWERQHLAGALNTAQDAFFHVRPYEQFFDLQDDRDEIRDRMGEPVHAARIKAMQRALDAHMLAVIDNGFIPEGDAAEGYDASRNPAAYPVARVMALAALAAQSAARNGAALRSALGDDTAVVRYWGAVGLRFLGPAAVSARGDLNRVMAGDPSVHVRIAAAEALLKLGNPAATVPLAELVRDPTQTKSVRLQALDALTYVGAAADPALPAVRIAAADRDPEVAAAARYIVALRDGTYTPSSQIYPAGPKGPSQTPLPGPAL